jgi:PHD/YefM family antitoxin component YafN of YafNO toxin-antitoxin module
MFGRCNMKAGTEKKEPQIVFRGGKPSAVILDIDAYQEILERLEDVEDIQMLARMRAKPLSFRKLDSFLKEFSSGV